VSAAGSAASAPFADLSSAKGAWTGAVVSTVIGGTLSKLSGGKFANGAVTAAMSYAFNQLAHQGTNATDDLTLTPDEEKQLIGLRSRFPSAQSQTESQMRVLSDGSVTSLTTEGCTSHSCSITRSQLAETRVVFHQHNVYDQHNIFAREWPSGGDVNIVRFGVINAIYTPSGAIRVVERFQGEYRVRTIFGGNPRINAYIARTWRPDMTDAQIGAAVRNFRSK
jgi:hypothetical protein